MSNLHCGGTAACFSNVLSSLTVPLAVLALSACSPPKAPAAAEPWRLHGDGGPVFCTLAIAGLGGRDGRAEPVAECAVPFTDTRAWSRTRDGLVLRDEDGGELMKFRLMWDGLYEQVDPGKAAVYLSKGLG